MHAWCIVFSNPRGRVLIIDGISCSPVMRVQHISYYATFRTLLTFQMNVLESIEISFFLLNQEKMTSRMVLFTASLSVEGSKEN